MTRFHRLALAAALIVSASAFSFARSPEFGVLVLSHGGTPTWNKTVKATVKKAGLPYPTRVFFGMAHSPQQVEELQESVEYLENKGVHTIIVIPLLVSSYS